MALKDRPIEGGHLWPVVIVSGKADKESGGSGPLYVSEAWTVTSTKEESANDSDKEFTVPAGQEWQILFLRVALVTTATVGARQFEIQIKDASGDIIFQFAAGVTQAASLTYWYNAGGAMPDFTSVRDTNFVSVPLPPGLILKALDSIRIFDNNAVDAAADDMSVYIQYAFRYV